MYGTREETYTESQFLEAVKTALSLDQAITISVAADAIGGTYTYIPAGSASDEQYEGKKDVATLFTLTGGSSATLTTAQVQTLINSLGEIRYYKEGATYYNVVMIRHFDDTEADWDAASGAYTGAHLGRYGVLRNNWYEIKVNSISGPGDPDIEDPEPEPDDDTEGYIRAEINVLSWAKRQQGVDL